MFDGDGECHRSAQRMANDDGLLQTKLFHEGADDVGLLRQAPGRAPGARRIARARPVERDQPVARSEHLEQRIGEMVQLGAEAVQEHDGRPLAHIDIVDAVALHLDELARRRHGAFDPGNDALRLEHEVADDGHGGQDDSGEQPEKNREQHQQPLIHTIRISACPPAPCQGKPCCVAKRMGNGWRQGKYSHGADRGEAARLMPQCGPKTKIRTVSSPDFRQARYPTRSPGARGRTLAEDTPQGHTANDVY